MNTIYKIICLMLLVSCLPAYAIDNTRSVGTAGGSVTVTPLGGASYSIPIEMPPGIRGMEPHISISYNSQAGNGIAGFGSSIGGISAITRGIRDIWHDGTASGINYDLHDAFYLDGQRLIEVQPQADSDSVVFRVENNPYTRVVLHGMNGSTQLSSWFSVTTSDGMTYTYGKADGRQYYYFNGIKVAAWYLDRAESATGNYITYSYSRSNYYTYLSEIRYGKYLNNSVKFEYEARPDSVFFSMEGVRGCMGRRLKTITTSSTAGGTELIFRTYSLAYDDTSDGTPRKYSRLSGVTESNGSGDSYNPTAFTWECLLPYSCVKTAPLFNTSLYSYGAQNDEISFFAADLNGDGLTDVVENASTHISGGSSQRFIRAYYAQKESGGGIEFNTAYYTTLPDDIGGTEWTNRYLSPAAADMDGDGVNELLVPVYHNVFETKHFGLYVYKDGQSIGGVAYRDVHANKVDSILWTADDFDRDGICDFVVMEKGHDSSNRYYGCIMGGCHDTTAYCQLFRFSLPQEPRHVLTADMDQDGMADIVAFYNGGYAVFRNDGTWLANRNYGNPAQDVPLEPTSSTHSNGLDPAHVWRGDFNGDGLADFLVGIYSSGDLYFEMGNGDGTLTKSHAASTLVHEQSGTEKDNDKTSCQVMDFDGDGLSDIILTKSMYAHHHDLVSDYYRFDKTHTYWLQSDGTRLVLLSHRQSSRAEDGLCQHYMSGDFNGDGLAELASLSYDCYGSGGNSGAVADESPVFRIYTMNGFLAGTGKVNGVTDGLGRHTSISYLPLTDESVYSRGSSALASFPAIIVTPALHVVASTDDDVAGQTDYHYEGLVFHMQGRGLIGMTATTASNMTTGRGVKKRVNSWHPSWQPTSVRTTETVGNDSLVTVEETTYQSYFTSSMFVPHIKNIRTWDYDGNITIEYLSLLPTYDGKPITHKKYHNDNRSEEIYYEYGRYGGQRLPTQVERWRFAGNGQPADISKTTFDYNSKGLMTERVDNYQTDYSLYTSFNYDSWGNLVRQDVHGGGVPNAVSTWQYDASSRFVTRSTELGYIVNEYTYDTWGNVLTATDKTRPAYPQTIVSSYDGWGNMTSTTSPDSLTTTYSRGWGSSATQRYFILEMSVGAPWKRTVYDIAGRETMVQSVGPGGVILLNQNYYNDKGEVSMTIEREGGRLLTTTFDYDARGRVLTEAVSPGPTTTYSYSNRSSTATTGGRSHTVTCDSWGGIVSVTDPSGSISYEYAPCGRPSSATSGGSTITMTYDDCGRQSRLCDPDAGTMTYSYDALGRVKFQTDGRGISTENRYNERGQLTETIVNDIPTTYTYGTSSTDNGLLLSTSRDGYSSAYQYDSHGRLTQETRNYVDGGTRAMHWTYDSLGRVATRTFPNQLTFRYEYDSYGHLKRIRYGQLLLYELTAYGGTTMTEALGQGLTRSATFDAHGRLLTAAVTRSSGSGTAIAPLQYNYDETTGNMVTRTVNGHPTETFTYDDADRLTHVHEGTMLTAQVQYAPNGNITFKSPGIVFTYDSIRPHAVKTAATQDGSPVPVTSGDIDIEYGELGKATMIEDYENQRCAIYYYGPDGERWESDGGLYFGDYEEVYDGLSFIYLDGGVLCATGPSGSPQFYYILADSQGSVVEIVDGQGTSVFSASYDPWGAQTVTRNDIGFRRGYTGHEMLGELGLVNMNGRLYDPFTARFLSPDNYVQQPDNSQNFNRYSYCLNNPLKYVDPSGEIFWIPIAFGAAIGGITNCVMNWDNIDGFWQGFTSAIVGAGAGAAVVATGGAAGTGVWSVIGASAASGAVTSATNNIIAQTGKDFRGIDKVDWTDVGKNSLVGAFAGAASGASGFYASNASFTVNNLNSPALRSAVASPTAAAAGHVVGGTVNGLLEGHSFETSFTNSFDGIWKSAAIGGAIGVASTVGVSYAKGVNPWTGENNYSSIIKEYGLENTIERIENGHVLTNYKHDGTIFRNEKSLLPSTNGIYREWVVPNPNLPVYRAGTWRIITSEKAWYYTPDHYKTFIRIK